MVIDLSLGTERTVEEKRDVLRHSAPKIVDAKKYHGPAVTDFKDIRERMNRRSQEMQ